MCLRVSLASKVILNKRAEIQACESIHLATQSSNELDVCVFAFLLPICLLFQNASPTRGQIQVCLAGGCIPSMATPRKEPGKKSSCRVLRFKKGYELTHNLSKTSRNNDNLPTFLSHSGKCSVFRMVKEVPFDLALCYSIQQPLPCVGEIIKIKNSISPGSRYRK